MERDLLDRTSGALKVQDMNMAAKHSYLVIDEVANTDRWFLDPIACKDAEAG